MTETLKTQVFRDREDNKKLFLARFEFPKYGEDFNFPDAIFVEDPENIVGLIDFLAGFPIDCVEMLVAIGEHSTKASLVSVKEVEGDVITAPIPDTFFYWPDPNKRLFNLTALPTTNFAKVMAENLEDEPKPTKLHWWFRVNMRKKEIDENGNETDAQNKFPVPGEFLAVGVRMMPDKPWGHQKSNPFLYAGNWMDTVYYTSGVITEVIAPTNDVLYPQYKVRWRSEEITARATDFAEYQVGDRVTVLKDIETTKTTQLWKDEDMTQYETKWLVAPITFYGLEEET
jgi:hypothetical protein